MKQIWTAGNQWIFSENEQQKVEENKFGDRLIKQLLNSGIAKSDRYLSVSRR